jgi:hypothetical protein
VKRSRSVREAIAQRLRIDHKSIYCEAIAQCLPSYHKSIAQRLKSYCEATAKRIHCDCTSIAHRLQIDCAAFVHRSCSDCAAFRKLSRSYCEANTQRLHIDYTSITNRLCSVCASIVQLLRSGCPLQTISDSDRRWIEWRSSVPIDGQKICSAKHRHNRVLLHTSFDSFLWRLPMPFNVFVCFSFL